VLSKKTKRGEMSCCKTTVHGKQIFFTAWMDTKPVHLLSTFCPYRATCVRKTKTGEGVWYSAELDRPTVIEVYNKAMGGTDKMDQLESYYDNRARTNKWQMRIFMHFLRIAALNARVLFNDHLSQNLTARTFIEGLVLGLCSTLDSNDIESDDHASVDSCDAQASYAPEKPVNMTKTTSWWIKNPQERTQGFHLPMAVSTSNPDSRGHCRVCNKKCRFKCRVCGVFLHIAENNEPDCYGVFHEREDFRSAHA
jgi:hypothetical protein